MPDAHSSDPHATRVIALYPDGWHAFALAGGATFGELARRLEDLDGAHDGAIIDVKVRFGKKSAQQTRLLLRSTEFGCVAHQASKTKLH